GIDPKLSRKKILKEESIAQLRDINDAVNVISKFSSILSRQTIATGGRALARQGSAVQVRILVLQIIGGDVSDALVILAVVNFGIEPDGGAAPAPVIQLHRAGDLLPDRKSNLTKKRRTP